MFMVCVGVLALAFWLERKVTKMPRLLPTPFRRIVQPDEHSCFACCAAMVTDESLEAVADFCGEPAGRGYSFIEILQYLSTRGFSMGVGAVGVAGNLDGLRWLPISIDMTRPAIVLVKARNHAAGHAVFWTGDRVLDPDPAAGNERKLSDYKVLQFWPVVKFI